MSSRRVIPLKSIKSKREHETEQLLAQSKKERKGDAPKPKKRRGRPVGSKNHPKVHPTDSRYLTVDQFCEQLRISRTTYQRHLPYMRVIKFGGRVLIPTEEVERYVQSFAREPLSGQSPSEGRAAP
jgi:excisionase family DNA binding protein